MKKMTSKEIRQNFLDFFKSKGHRIEGSAPIVRKNDPTLMFTNSGMAPFKDFFLGNNQPPSPRIADTQKCLRVSGKHNDLEEVGIDSYHHTMFEMLGNWSFGDYFKKEAIEWAWSLLTEVYQLPKDRLYVTIFEGNKEDGVERDVEALEIWKQFLPAEKILDFGRKDNFWEMGDTGPCGPCSEIHVDLRSDEEIALKPGVELVNQDHPQVVEIWNLVFMQFNRMENGSLVPLPSKHVDTGMGFERLCMAIQGKKSNYETDVFSGYIQFLEKKTGITYTNSYELSAKSDIAFRVIADHIRAVSFAIADGQLPENTGAGYVIRRILRRAVRYYFSFLQVKEPIMHELVALLAEDFKDVFPELHSQKDLVAKVIYEEERSFLKTLEEGLKRMDLLLQDSDGVIDGKSAFELYDTFGFPIDLTRLIASEKGISIDEVGFEAALLEQKNRSRKDAEKSIGDWTQVVDDIEVDFLGYDSAEVEGVKIVKYRKIKAKNKEYFQLVLDKTPFYAESGGQVGDLGTLTFEDGSVLQVVDTQKENNLIVHLVNKLPDNPNMKATAKIDYARRKLIENNHTATHLLHAALRQVLGTHVHQKGSLVQEKNLRFDFSHFQKMTTEEIEKIEQIVNQKIRENITKKEQRELSLEEASKEGAMMLFGEKYGEKVRVITFGDDYSKELCGGCHVRATGDIGFFKIIGESAVAAGIRRVEAITAEAAESYVSNEMNLLQEVRNLLKNPKDLTQAVQSIQDNIKLLEKQIDELMAEKASRLKDNLVKEVAKVGELSTLFAKVELDNGKYAKNLVHEIEDKTGPIIIGLGFLQNDKPQILLLISKELSEKYQLDAGAIVRQAAKQIQGGGGGQKFFATAGGNDPSGLNAALEEMKSIVSEKIKSL